jgi:2-oxoglutarate ferredoxin oxidoreductase subunit delta
MAENKVKINKEKCKSCGYCVADCPRKALSFSGSLNEKGYNYVQVDDALCVGCGTCYRVCPDCVFEIVE